jgi:hypothetical protein
VTVRSIVVSILVGGLFIFSLFGSVVPNRASSAQIASPILPNAPPFIQLGFGPNSLSPASQGAPIFAINDSLWIYSTFNQAVTANLLSPSNQSHADTLLPSQILSLYTFARSDAPGEWTLYLTLQNSTYYAMPIFFVEPFENTAPASLSEYSIQNGQINLGFSINAQDSYEKEGCLTSGNHNGSFELAEPTSLGTGDIALSLDPGNSSAIVASVGQVNSPFSFWFELDYSYAYATSLANATISRNIMVARSASVLFNSSTSQLVPLPIESNLRTGRYEIRGYFDSGSGLSVAETSLLYMGSGTWFWLSSCSPFTINGNTFSKQVNLSEDPRSWPTTLYFMYQNEGIDEYSIIPLQINLARLDFIGQPGNVSLSAFTYSVANNSDIEASGDYSGSVYVIARSYPLSLTVTPIIGKEDLPPINVVLTAPFTDTQTSIAIGKLTVQVLNNSRPDIGATVQVTNSQGATLTSTIPGGGNTSFNVPAGFYNIAVSKNGATELGNATVYDGDNTVITITVTSGLVPTSYLEYLIIPLVLGLILNAWAWVIGPRREKYPRME